ncbi:C-C motif chemokine 20 [Tenrec ecaudatus]|uniref:C-C motif chemokine 20 n=1 Tax=Tenrec ecaudatus TaxID=94439 RepID=UPI003F5994E6
MEACPGQGGRSQEAGGQLVQKLGSPVQGLPGVQGRGGRRERATQNGSKHVCVHQQAEESTHSLEYAASNFDCCLRYYESFKIHPSHFVGFTIQRADEVCDINAVIFHFKSGGDICVNPKQPWVKAAVKIVSKRVRNL